jgi:hypothetical protein
MKKSFILSIILIVFLFVGCGQKQECRTDTDCNKCNECISNSCKYIQDCCIDTDAYYDYYEKGESRINDNIKEDTCYKRENYNALYDIVDNCSGFNCGITEYGCHDNKIVSDIEDCPYGCRDGACINDKGEKISRNCFDTDGNNISNQGQVIHHRSNAYNPELNYQLVAHSDVCLTNGYVLSKSGDALNEQICENGRWVSQIINCTCQDGACINTTTA